MKKLVLALTAATTLALGAGAVSAAPIANGVQSGASPIIQTAMSKSEMMMHRRMMMKHHAMDHHMMRHHMTTHRHMSDHM